MVFDVALEGGWVMRWMVVLAVAAAALAGVSVASAHPNPCHKKRSCPSDHHQYRWGSKRLLCTSVRKERRKADTAVVVWKGRRYWCSRPAKKPVKKPPVVVPAGSVSEAAEAVGLAIARRFDPAATHRYQVFLPSCSGGKGHYVCSGRDANLSVTAKVDWSAAGPTVTFTSFVCSGSYVGRPGC